MSSSVDINYGATTNNDKQNKLRNVKVNGIPLYHIIYRSLCALLIISAFICVGYLSLNSYAYHNKYVQISSNNDVESYNEEIGGFYTDPNHYKGIGTFAGTRMVSDFNGVITMIGSDDGIEFWTVTGKYTDKLNGKISMDFTPKNGPIISGQYMDGYIEWEEDGNKWTKSTLNNL
mmetsp:Transcript_77501/g.69388  ORF Transcript_77501/g.69388 Transcript_77501/m.69388 type:complete len:175 (+) Transcript_77501:22-546(+)